VSPEIKNQLKAFGLRVRKLREALDWSQDQLAEQADLHRTYISGLERGERNVSVLNILRLARALKTTPGKLLDDIGRLTQRFNSTESNRNNTSSYLMRSAQR
jgi:transcriptional regulator with XRE-family HTH domain